MSNKQFQSEHEYYPRANAEVPIISGRAWVKRDFEFWHRCTIDHASGTAITVSFDNMDELTVNPDDVAQFDLPAGELVFVYHWTGSLSGSFHK